MKLCQIHLATNGRMGVEFSVVASTIGKSNYHTITVPDAIIHGKKETIKQKKTKLKGIGCNFKN